MNSENKRENEKHKNIKNYFALRLGRRHHSPPLSTTSQSINIVNVILYMKRNAYAETTIKKVAKLLRHLKKNCNTKQPEEVKLYIANKTCENGHYKSSWTAFNSLEGKKNNHKNRYKKVSR